MEINETNLIKLSFFLILALGVPSLAIGVIITLSNNNDVTNKPINENIETIATILKTVGGVLVGLGFMIVVFLGVRKQKQNQK